MPNHKLLHNSQGIKSTVLLLAAVAAFTFFSHKVEAEILFEGYYKVGLSGVHSGYMIQRYEFDAKKGEFSASSYAYVKLSPDGKQFLNESLVAKADQAFNPIKYQYSKLSSESDPQKPGQLKTLVSTIDGNFKKQKDGRVAAVFTGIKDGKNYSAKSTLQKNMFLSSFLLYLMLQKGLQAGRSFAFEAIAEESGTVEKGDIQLGQEQKYKGLTVFKMDWKFKDIRSVSFISTTGEAISTETANQGVLQELVANRSDAIANFKFPEKSIKGIFNGIPDGKSNSVYKLANEPAAPSANAMPVKKSTQESLNSPPPAPKKAGQ